MKNENKIYVETLVQEEKPWGESSLLFSDDDKSREIFIGNTSLIKRIKIRVK